MKVVGPRTYDVTRAELPLSIVIAPKNTSGSKATTVIVGHVREVKGGVELDERDVKVTDRQGVKSYDIAAPSASGSVDVVQTLLAFFASTEKGDARFDVIITSARGDTATTAIRVPTINPSAATLKFHL
jgi:hypothetical protein